MTVELTTKGAVELIGAAYRAYHDTIAQNVADPSAALNAAFAAAFEMTADDAKATLAAKASQDAYTGRSRSASMDLGEAYRTMSFIELEAVADAFGAAMAKAEGKAERVLAVQIARVARAYTAKSIAAAQAA